MTDLSEGHLKDAFGCGKSVLWRAGRSETISTHLCPLSSRVRNHIRALCWASYSSGFVKRFLSLLYKCDMIPKWSHVDNNITILS